MNKMLIMIEEWVAITFFFITTFLVFVGAVGRTAGHPIIWSIDIAQLCFAWSCVLGADLALKKNLHVEIDVLVKLFPQKIKRFLGYLWLLVIILFLGLLVYLGFGLTFANTQRPLGDTGLSYSFVTASVPVGCFLMLMTCLSRFYKVLVGKENFSLEGRDSLII